MHTDVRQFHKFAKDRGWKVSPLKGGHYSLTNPQVPGVKLTSSSTPSDNRSMLNARAMLLKAEREAGLFVERHPHKKKKGRRPGRKPTENFPATQTVDDAGRTVTVYRATCSNCRTAPVMTLKGRGHTPADVARAFRALGWTSATRRAEDLCPRCVEKTKGEPAPRAEHAADVAAPNGTPPQADLSEAKQLQSVSYGAKQAVYEALRVAYLSPDFGYREGESDATIASVCDVSEQVVANMRGELFGPAHSELSKTERLLLLQQRALKGIAKNLTDMARALDTAIAEIRKA